MTMATVTTLMDQCRITQLVDLFGLFHVLYVLFLQLGKS